MKNTRRPARAGTLADTQAETLRPITLADRPLFDAAFSRLRDPLSDMTFASCYLWAETLGYGWLVLDDHLCVFSTTPGDRCLILPPLALSLAAEKRFGPCLEACFAVMDEWNTPRGGPGRSRIEYVSDELLDRLRGPGAMALSAEPMDPDYVYPAAAMISLEGGPLKNKRKLRNGFLRDHPAAYTDALKPEHEAACFALLETWKRHADAAHEGETNDRFVGAEELRAHDESCSRAAVRECRALGLEGLTLWDPEPGGGARLLGFTIGERHGETSAVIHVEKVDPGVRGGAQFIFSEFCRTRFADRETINAGDDWGLPTLRFTKMSYRPSRLLAKSALTRQSAPAGAGGVEPAAVRAIATVSRPHAAPDASTAPAPGGGASIRRAERSDAAAILAIEGAAFARADERFTLRQARRLIENPRAAALVIEDAAGVFGWAVALTRRARGRNGRVTLTGRLYAIAVHPDRAGSGAGRRLATAALAALDGIGASRVYLEVREDNAPAIALYRSLGFAPVAALPHYYGAGRSGVRMRRESQTAALGDR